MIVGLIDRIKEYVKLKVQQIKLELVGHVARLMSQLLVMAFLVMLGLFMLFFFSFALGSFLNGVLESNYLGHLVVGACYFIVFLILALLARAGKIQGWLEAAILKASDQIDEDE